MAIDDVPTGFVRAEDAIVLAVPFSLTGERVRLASAHGERLAQAVQRHFVRSKMLVNGPLAEALERGCTAELGYRLMGPDSGLPVGADAVVLTCSPPAHLALVNFLERGALFTADVVGRVVRRAG